MANDIHLYLILFPTTALIGSQLEPEAFAKHFNAGSSKFYSGKMIFAEIDAGYRHPYFRLDEQLKDVKAHADGRPRATKYISNYRVLEHIDFAAIGPLYISTPEGYILPLHERPYDALHQPGFIRVFCEITPVSMLVLSDYNFLEFSRFITDPLSSVGASKIFYTQIDLDIQEFLADLTNNSLTPSPIPDVHPSVLRDSIMELQTVKTKHTKGLSLANPLGKISFRNLRHGFMFASQEKNRFYGLPSLGEIEKKNYKFFMSFMFIFK